MAVLQNKKNYKWFNQLHTTLHMVIDLLAMDGRAALTWSQGQRLLASSRQNYQYYFLILNCVKSTLRSATVVQCAIVSRVVSILYFCSK